MQTTLVLILVTDVEEHARVCELERVLAGGSTALYGMGEAAGSAGLFGGFGGGADEYPGGGGRGNVGLLTERFGYGAGGGRRSR